MKDNEDSHGPVFIDTNIWLYAFIEAQDQNKSQIARSILKQKEVALSTQVINEICVNLLKKAGFQEEKIQRLIASFYQKHRILEHNKDSLLHATILRQKYRFSYWDSLIVSCALEAESKTLYSEDMQHNLVVENTLKIINPFQLSAKSIP